MRERASREIPPIFAPDDLVGELAKLSPPELTDLVYWLANVSACVAYSTDAPDEEDVLAELRLARARVLTKRGHLATSITMKKPNRRPAHAPNHPRPADR